MSREWSNYQRAVFEDIGRGAGHTVVKARAGSGKTTTIMEGLGYLDPAASALLCAFNKRIAEELERRVPRSVDCEVKTLHSLGFQALKTSCGRGLKIDADKGKSIARRIEDQNPMLGRFSGKLAKLVGLAKNTLATTVPAIETLAIVHGIADETLTEVDLAPLALEAIELAKREMGTIDFDDMVAMPALLGARPPKFDFVLVDETQDLNAAQLWLVLRAVGAAGRIIAVGDDRQAIYQFRGADEEAMGKMTVELKAKTLPLSITYRCPVSVVRLVNQFVPDFEAAPGAAEGEVLPCGVEVLAHPREGAKPGDFVLSRTNAPLMGICLGFLRANVPASIAGKDIGTSLISLARRSRRDDVLGLVRWLDDYVERERAKLVAAKKEELFEEIADRAEALRVLSEGLRTTDEVIDRIEDLFEDKDDHGRVVCSTTHKAKGLERRRVWMLHDTFLKRRKGQQGPSVAEQNLYYVAATRAMETLFAVCEKTYPAVSTGPKAVVQAAAADLHPAVDRFLREEARRPPQGEEAVASAAYADAYELGASSDRDDEEDDGPPVKGDRDIPF